MNKIKFWTKCGTWWPIYELNYTIFSSSYSQEQTFTEIEADEVIQISEKSWF